MNDIVAKISKALHKNYEVPSQLDVKEGAIFLYVNLPRFLTNEKNRIGQEPVCAYVMVDSITGDGDEAVVHLSVLHVGPIRAIAVPIQSIVTVTPAYTYHTNGGEEICFFIAR